MRGRPDWGLQEAIGVVLTVELFGVAIVVLLAGITLLVLLRSAADGRSRRSRGHHEGDAGSPTEDDMPAGADSRRD
jgi:hypothetical protein